MALFTPKLVALDVDGTVVGRDGALSPTIADSVARVVAAGVPVVISTGRSWNGTLPIVEALDLPAGPHVTSNGAVMVNHPPFEVLHAVTFDPGAIIRRIHDEAPHAAIAVEDVGKGYRLSSAFPEGELSGEMTLQGIDELCASPVTRVVVRDEDATEQEFVELAERLGLHGVSYFVGYTAWLDIAPEGIDKSYGLAMVCKELGVKAIDVLAIGDGSNDVEMLRWAGRGVALGDGNSLAITAADHVTDAFDDGGTAKELDRWFA